MGVSAGHYIGKKLKDKGVANPVIVEIAGIDDAAADPGPQQGLRRRAEDLRLQRSTAKRTRSSPSSPATRSPEPAPGAQEDRRDLEPRRRPGRRRARRDQAGGPRRVLHGRRRRIRERDARDQGRRGVLEATVTYPPTMAASAIKLARLIAPGQGHERPGRAGDAGVDHAVLRDGHQGQRRPRTCRRASNPEPRAAGAPPDRERAHRPDRE